MRPVCQKWTSELGGLVRIDWGFGWGGEGILFLGGGGVLTRKCRYIARGLCIRVVWGLVLATRPCRSHVFHL